jgi:hypothetical protein
LDVLAHALVRCHADRVTGVLRIVGKPGGLFHLSDGLVIAVDCPGSPGAETLLLRSGRISEGRWTSALRDRAGTGSQLTALVERGDLGSAELVVIVMAAMRDGVFATAAGEVERYVIDDEPGDVLLSVPNGVAPDLLLPETARRLAALASLPAPVSPYRERVVAVRGVAALTVERREIVAHATGRRTARDIAFAVGRGVYPVTVEISRMLTEGLVEIAPPVTAISSVRPDLASLRARVEMVEPGADRTGALPVRDARVNAPEDRPRTSEWRVLSRLLRLFETERKNVGP